MPDTSGEAFVSLSLDVLESISIAITNYLGQKLPEDDLATKASAFLSDIIKIGEDLEKKGLRSNETIRSLLEYAKQEEDKLRLNGESRTSALDDFIPAGKDNKMSIVDTLMKMLGDAGMASGERPDTPKPEEEPKEENEEELLPMSSAADLISSHPDDEEDEEILRRIRAERAKKQDPGNENPVDVKEFNEFDKF